VSSRRWISLRGTDRPAGVRSIAPVCPNDGVTACPSVDVFPER